MSYMTYIWIGFQIKKKNKENIIELGGVWSEDKKGKLLSKI